MTLLFYAIASSEAFYQLRDECSMLIESGNFQNLSDVVDLVALKPIGASHPQNSLPLLSDTVIETAGKTSRLVIPRASRWRFSSS